MSLQDQLDSDYIEAVKAKDKSVVSILRMLKAAILNKKIASKISKDDVLPEDEILAVIKSEVKKRKDSIVSYQEGSRDDLVKKEQQEITVLEKYLPEQMSEDQVREIVQGTIAEVGASGAGDFGKVMGVVMTKTKGQTDGQIVADVVKEELNK